MKLNLFVQEADGARRAPTAEEHQAGIGLHARINELHLQLTAAHRECQQQGHALRFVTTATPDGAEQVRCYTCGVDL